MPYYPELFSIRFTTDYSQHYSCIIDECVFAIACYCACIIISSTCFAIAVADQTVKLVKAHGTIYDKKSFMACYSYYYCRCSVYVHIIIGGTVLKCVLIIKHFINHILSHSFLSFNRYSFRMFQ